jgi:hypothetical protein
MTTNAWKTATGAIRHAGGIWRRLFYRARRPLRKIESEAHHLRESAHVNEGDDTPPIEILGLVLFLASVYAVMASAALVAYYFA